jgi:hypothetical protein
VGPTLKVVMQNDGDFVDVILLYLQRQLKEDMKLEVDLKHVQ